MHYIIYLSTGIKWFSEAELAEILTASNKNNRRDNITGLLLYNDGNFIQLLEGDEADVQHTFQRISTDQRHKSITPIASGKLKKRNFPEWAMGFRSIYANDIQQLEGIYKPGGNTLTLSADSHLSVKMLNAFLRTARLDL